ncbi:MAG TPA: hypothetical protein VHY91_17345 [Pirellulales bacterium]|jgi:hypothetical protein|nr:hypothetical protein [Pirellulales bacterium]
MSKSPSGGGDWTPDDVRRILANPFYCINIDPRLATEHQPMISEDQWIDAAAKQIKRDGAEKFLRAMLKTLKDPGAEIYGYQHPDPERN